MDTKSVGDVSEAMILAALLKLGKKMLIPFGEGHRYDLVMDDEGEFVRIQVKTGRLIDGAVQFKTHSDHWHRGGACADYRGTADMFGVYCPENGMCYMVPVLDLGTRTASLRVVPTKNNQQMGVRLAEDFVIG